MIVTELIYNLSILLALTVLTEFLDKVFNKENFYALIFKGLLFGGVAIIGMMNPFTLTEGIIFDGRSIIISLSTLFFGPVVGLIASLSSIIFRISLGGIGVLTGTLTIMSSFLIGLLGYYLKRKNKFKLSFINLFLFGFLVNVVVLILFLTFPSPYRAEAYNKISLSYLIFFPVLTVVIGKILLDQEEKEISIQKIKESEEKFRALYYYAPLSYQSLDPEERLLDVNPMWLKTLGYSREEVIGHNFTEFLHPDYIKSFSYQFPTLKEKGYKENVQYKIRKKNGEFIFISVDAEIGCTPEGDFKQAYYVFKDITLQKQAEEELVRAKEKAEESDRLKTAFLQNMSHEIRTPLNGILGFASILNESENTKEDVITYSGMIKNSGYRLLNMINNIIEISKIESGNLNIVNSVFSLNNLMREIFNQHKISAGEKNLELKMNLTVSDENSFIESDSLLFLQLITNFVSNAIKFTKEGSVEFGYHFIESEIMLFIKDTGTGIPIEYHNKIFDRFYQIDMTLSRGYEGVGLGLAICKGIVQSLNGRIELESEENKGTTFKIYLPIKRVQQNDTDDKNINTKLNITNRAILIAEDDDMSFDYLNLILHQENIEVIRAFNGEEAVAICKKRNDINIVLMDLKMPVMNGYEATKIIKEFRPDIKIIAQTAYAYKQDKDEAFKAGCDDYLTKPISKTELFECLEKIL